LVGIECSPGRGILQIPALTNGGAAAVRGFRGLSQGGTVRSGGVAIGFVAEGFVAGTLPRVG
jgi:hypothetical protein